MPTAPVHQGCAAIHAMASTPSCVSASVYSSVQSPVDSPVPRMSIRMPA